MNLQIQFNRLEARLALVEGRFTIFENSRAARLDHKDWMFLEGLLSATWQHWCHFCRSVVIKSALGADTSTGVRLAPCATSWEEVSYQAIQAAKKQKPKPGGSNNLLRLEPTWGDLTKLLLIISRLELSNKDHLAKSFGASSYISHAQVVRNAAAHRNHQNTADVLSLRPLYIVSRLRHPSEALLWIEQHSQDYAFLFWLNDMRIVGSLAIQ